jgi:hypothetical protein
MRKRPWDSEAHAAEIVSAHLGGTTRRIDPGGGATQLHDFDVELKDGATIAVEVTRHNVPSSLAVLTELDKRDWHFAQLRHDWVVDMIPTYIVAKVHGEIARLVAAFEGAGIEALILGGRLFRPRVRSDELDDDERDAVALLDRTGTREAAEELWNLGARLIYRLGPAEPSGGEIIMGEASRAGSTGASLIVELVEHHVAKTDNRNKLAAAADRLERHLFVWVETSQYAAVAAFGFSNLLPDGAGLPGDPPQLPAEVDAVWVVTAYDSAHIWQYHRAKGWRDLGTWQRRE